MSEEDQKKGKAVGDVMQYRYLGEMGGRITLERVGDTGAPLARLECRRECRIMKLVVGDSVSRVPFDPASVGGSAMDDALNGFLGLKPNQRLEGPAVF